MKIAIMSAMIEELQPIVDSLKCSKIDEVNGQVVYEYVSENHTLYFLNSGIGKVNAAITTTLLITKYEIDKVLNIGTAGGVNPNLSIGDFVVANNLVFHDVDVTAFGYAKGQIPHEDQYFNIEHADEFYNNLRAKFDNVHIGTVCTGDQFISSNEIKKEIESNFKDVYAIEMESSAIVMTCRHLETDCLVLRTISDLAYEESTVEFDKYLTMVSKGFILLVEDILQNGWFYGN